MDKTTTGKAAEELIDVANLTVEERANKSGLSLNKKRTPIHIKWDNIHFSIPITTPESKPCNKQYSQKTILDNISGEAKPGSLIAIMGPSGSGKTTLLNCLAKRTTGDKGSILDGKITLNGVDRQDLGSKFARIAGYVQQDDILFSMQTVFETLLTAAKLRLPKDVTLAQKEERCNAIIQELGLSKARDTRIGDAQNKGVSGGERKRCNIGVEMIQDPSVLFLDEPTSGLDSFQALNVVETLKILCQSGCTVIMSIHQPRSSIFQLFDQLILLSDGKLVYSGTAGETAVNYFANLGFQCPDLFNPADYFLDIISVDNRTKEEEARSQKRIEFLTESYEKHQFKQKAKSQGSSGQPESLSALRSARSVTSGFLTQMKVLGLRSARQIVRDKVTLAVRTFMTVFFAAFLAALYSETNNGQKSIQDKQGILFFITINQSFGPLLGALNVFIVEKAIVQRERQAKSYNVSSYYLTKLITTLPLDVVFPCIFGSVVYWVAGLNPTAEAFVMFLVINVICSLCSIAIGFAIAAFAPSLDAANAMAPLIMVLSILFGGFYINTGNIPIWIRWLDSVSHIRWAFTSFCINEFTGSKFNGCDDGQTGCFQKGEQILELLSMDSFTLWDPIRNMLLIILFYHTVAFLCLRFKKARYLEVTDPDQNGRSQQRQSQLGLIENKHGTTDATAQIAATVTDENGENAGKVDTMDKTDYAGQTQNAEDEAVEVEVVEVAPKNGTASEEAGDTGSSGDAGDTGDSGDAMEAAADEKNEVNGRERGVSDVGAETRKEYID